MFQNDMTNVTDFNTKQDSRQSYLSWLEQMDISHEDFPFSVKTSRMHKGREIIHTVRSWGWYSTVNGRWIIFIAYYFPAMKHITQYTWFAGENGKANTTPEKHEWIGG